MKKRTRKNCKKGGSSNSIDSWKDWKTDHPEIMSAYNDAQSTSGSLGIGVIGTIAVA